MQKTNSTKGICIDAFRCAGRDLFPLILDIEKLLQAYGMESVSFISDVFSTASRAEQLEIIINVLRQIQHTNEESVITYVPDELPEPIRMCRRIAYNSIEAWKNDNKEMDDATV